MREDIVCVMCFMYVESSSCGQMFTLCRFADQMLMLREILPPRLEIGVAATSSIARKR